MFWGQHDMGWWGYAGVGIVMVLFWALIIVGIIALIRLSMGGRADLPPQRHYPSPGDILADRFARGEIDEAEYQNRLRLLRENSRP